MKSHLLFPQLLFYKENFSKAGLCTQKSETRSQVQDLPRHHRPLSEKNNARGFGFMVGFAAHSPALACPRATSSHSPKRSWNIKSWLCRSIFCYRGSPGIPQIWISTIDCYCDDVTLSSSVQCSLPVLTKPSVSPRAFGMLMDFESYDFCFLLKIDSFLIQYIPISPFLMERHKGRRIGLEVMEPYKKSCLLF